MRTGRRTLMLLIALVALVVLAGCSGGGDTGGDTSGVPTGGGTSGSTGTTVTESGNVFDPPALTVSVGDVVTFTNQDVAVHQVLIDGVTLDRQGQGESVTWTAARAGTFDYICTVHPSMRGRIEVK